MYLIPLLNIKISIPVKNLLLLLTFLVSGLSLSAQEGWELGGWVGTANYFGDLNTTFDVSEAGLAAGAIARYNFNSRICMKATFNYLKIGATDMTSDNSFERTRNLDFRSDVFDGSFNFEFNFLNYVHGSRDEFFTPYLFAGFSIFNFSPKTDLDNETYALRDFGTEGQFRGEEYGTVSGGLNYGLGFKVDLSYRWSINIELSSRKLFTDYIDDVSGVYPDFDDLEGLRGETAVLLSDRSVGDEGVSIAEEGRQRGNGRKNDSYTTLGVGLVYYFGSLKCPPISR